MTKQKVEKRCARLHHNGGERARARLPDVTGKQRTCTFKQYDSSPTHQPAPDAPRGGLQQVQDPVWAPQQRRLVRPEQRCDLGKVRVHALRVEREQQRLLLHHPREGLPAVEGRELPQARGWVGDGGQLERVGAVGERLARQSGVQMEVAERVQGPDLGEQLWGERRLCAAGQWDAQSEGGHR